MQQLLISTYKGLFIADAAGSIIQRAFIGEPVTFTLKDSRDGTLYAALNLGHFGAKLHRSKDGGATWQEVSCPAFEKSEGEDGRAVEMIWVLAEDGGDAGGIYAGTIPAALWHSSDGGESWSLNEALDTVPEKDMWMGGGFDEPGLHSILVDPRSPDQLTVGISCGGVWRSEDRGQSWMLRAEGMRAEYVPPGTQDHGAVQDPHILVQCAAAPEHFWSQHHTTIYRSANDLTHWEEIDRDGPNRFGFACAVHPADPLTAWFVPAVKDEQRYPQDGKFLVTRTRDGGKSFESLSAGLPQDESYDLVYRHALVVDNTGTRLAMGSTTGGLWTSADSGDSWAAHPIRFPPIAALEFTADA